MTVVQERGAEEAESALASAVVRVKGADGAIGGAGFLIAPDLVLTCAHVVSDALDRPREDEVGAGTEVSVDLPLAGNVDGVDGGEQSAEVQRWIPIRADQSGDIAVLRLRNRIPGARPLPMVDPVRDLWDHDSRAVGFTDDTPGEIWQSGRFRGPTRQGWIQLSRTDGEAVYVKQGFSGTPVWDNELGAAVGMMVAAQPVREAQQAFVLRTRTLLKEVPELAPFVGPATPFRGLSTFQEDDADVFFGRDDDIDRVVTALRGDQPTVTVYGPSGCGKSSLALAGAVPRMRRDGYRILRVNAVHSDSPRVALANELFEMVRSGQYGPPRAESADQVESWLVRLGLTDTVHRALGSAADRLLVVLDQAEALLDHRRKARAKEVADLLFPERQHDGLRVLVTLRADFMDAALNHACLGPALKKGVTVPLTPMSRDQLAQVISEPVKRISTVDYEPGLERRILDDAGGEPGILPLLGFVLSQLWKHKAAGRLRTATYEENEGVSGALKLHAEQAWQECVEKQHKGKGGEEDKDEDERKREALRLLTGLVRVLPGSEAPLRRMLTQEEANRTQWRIAKSLAARRLLVLHGDEGQAQSVELAHEALISAWPTLAQQVKADAEFLAGRAELGHDLDRWQKANRSPDLLPSSLQLLSLHNRLHSREKQLTPEERDFLDRAQRRQRARRNRVRVAWTAIAVVFALIVGLGTFLAYQSRVSTQREAEGRSRLLANFSEEVAKQDPGQAALIAMAAYEVAPTDEARNAMLRRYDEFKGAAWLLSGTEGKIQDAVTSVDGTVTLVTSDNARATLFVRQAGGRILRHQLGLTEMALHPLVSRDRRRIAYLSAAGTLVWRDVNPEAGKAEDMLGAAHTVRDAEFKDKADLEVQSDEDSVMAFSPDARHLASVGDGRLRVWDLEAARYREVPGRVPATGVSVWFGPDEDTLVVRRPSSGKRGSSLAAVDVSTGKVRELADGVDTSALFGPATTLSGDGSVLVVCSAQKQGSTTDAVYRALRVTDGRMLNSYTNKDDSCESIAVDEKGERFAVNHLDTWTLVGTRRGSQVQQATGPSLENHTGRLLGDAHAPVVLALEQDENALTALPLNTGDIEADDIVVNDPKLIDGGKAMVARVRQWDEPDDDETLALIDVPSERIMSEVKQPEIPGTPASPDRVNSLTVNDAGTLVADVVGRNKILVRQIPSLRKVAEIATLTPPDDTAYAEPLLLDFDRGDELLTVSGSRIEHWNAREGRLLSKTIDVRALKLGKKVPPVSSSGLGDVDSGFAVNSHSEAGYVQIMVKGDPTLHAVNLRTGKENKTLRVSLSPDVERAFLDSSGRYAAAKTPGGMLELWSVGSRHSPKRGVGPLGPLGANDAFTGKGFTFNFTGSEGEFYVANGSSVRFQQASDPSHFESYDFSRNQHFMAATRDGKTLVRAVSESGLGETTAEDGWT